MNQRIPENSAPDPFREGNGSGRLSMDAPDNTTVEAGATPVLSGKQRQLWLFPAARPLVERFGVEFFRSLPEGPGIYLMCGVLEGVLYVGKARSLRRRLGSYRSVNPARVSRKIRRLLATVNRIYWDECDDEAGAIARERELLRTLRPKFNTAGTYSAPRHHVGWQRSAEELRIGIDEATVGWEHRFGEFIHLKPVHAALLRLLWRALHPSAPVHDMPSSLLREAPPPVCRLRESSREQAAPLNEVTRRLDEFLRGAAPDFPGWLMKFGASGSRFEEQWRENDVLCLDEFYERQLVSAVRDGRDESYGGAGLH